jgi:hypothetical protein
LQNQLYNSNYASHTYLDLVSDKATVSSIWDFKLTPKQWRIDRSDRKGSYVYVVLRISPRRLLIAIVIRISDLNGNRYWSLPSVHLEAPVLLFHLLFVEINLKQRCTRLSLTNISTTTASDGISYQMSGPICLQVRTLDMFLVSNLTDKSGEIPKRISLPKIEYKPKAPSSANFTGRRDYLTKLRDFFGAKSDGPLRRKSFLLYGMGGIGKTEICLRFTEENEDL